VAQELHKIGLRYKTDKATHHKYCDFYQKNLPDRDFSGRLLEIGIMDGNSLRMWKEYYPKAEIVGIDIHKKPPIKGVTVLQMDGTDPKQLKTLGEFQIIVDDGSHNTLDQQKSFEQLYYKQLSKGGFYILEDLHTSLMPNYVNSELTTLEYLDKLDLDIKHFRRSKEADSMSCVIFK